ncbi:hypothetical protein BGX30_011270 [Mortierella sp. GBA39]|nr:hypothetical protein BGX30_011270 [Mortierella sp. GBA39]
MKQEEINQLLVDLALQGKTVVRLKGGDPTIFGRVGEEAELLRRNGIPYEIVPGITAAIGVPAYAGIPVTHRDLASSLSIITGHESPDKLDRMIEWDKVTNATGTLVFMMGVAKIGYIAEQLMRHGRKPDTPVALIRWGTRAEQAVLAGTLADIAEKVKQANFQPPAVIVVGDVVRQREQLKWAESLPLFGKRILVTRSRAQASDLVNRIEELGGEPYEFPESLGSQLLAGQKVFLPRGDLARNWLPDKLAEMGLEVTSAVMYQTIAGREDDPELIRLLEEGGIHAVTFTSSSTVNNLLSILQRMGVQDPAALLQGVEVACIGEITAKTARDAGLEVGIIAEEATLDSLVRSLCLWNAEAAAASE